MPNRLLKSIARLIYGKALVLGPARMSPAWTQRQFLRRLLRELDVDCVLDVGANVGQFGAELRLIGYRGTIISFEPAPGAFEKLALRAAADPRWHTVNSALGAKRGEGELKEMVSSDFSSFLSPSIAETDELATFNKVARHTVVAVDTLSAVLPDLASRHGFHRPFLKMDTQGFDPQVFRGAAGVLDQIVGLQSEVPFKRLYDGALNWQQTLAEYEAGGFNLVGLFKVNPHHVKLIECDCYMIRHDLLNRLYW